MPELPIKDLWVVNGDNQEAEHLMRRLCERKPKPGQVVFVTNEQFEILKNGVIRIQLPENQ